MRLAATGSIIALLVASLVLVYEALEQIRQGIRERSGAKASRAACDYGSNYLANDFQASYTRIVHNFHGFTRQLKYTLLGCRETPAPR